MKKLIGYQLADANGKNIQGDGTCPVDFASFEILSFAAANAVMIKLAEMDLEGHYLLQPIVEGDVEEYELIEQIDYIANIEYLVLTGCEGEEKDPIYCPNASDKDAAVIKAEDRGEFCVVHELATPIYTTS